MVWLYLGMAIVFEVAGTVSLKLAAGFTRLGPSVAIVPLYGASLAFLVLALKTLPVSMAYAIWAALGTALVAAIGILYFREPVTLLKIACLGLIIAGVLGLHLSDRVGGPV